jgi:hypothetical protein
MHFDVGSINPQVLNTALGAILAVASTGQSFDLQLHQPLGGKTDHLIICSSVNLASFICPSFFRPDSNSIWRKYAVAGQSQSKGRQKRRL